MNNEWYTPKDLVIALLDSGKKLFGDEFIFDLDPASSYSDLITPLSKQIYTKEDDGLKQDWGTGYIFCNPPFQRYINKNGKKVRGEYDLLGRFCNRMIEHENGIVLTFDKPSVLTHSLRMNSSKIVCFRKRVNYITPTGRSSIVPADTILYGFGDKAKEHLSLLGEEYLKKYEPYLLK